MKSFFGLKIELWTRMALDMSIYKLDETLYDYRQHSGVHPADISLISRSKVRLFDAIFSVSHTKTWRPL